MMRAYNKIGLYWRTIRDLKLGQLANRFKRKLFFLAKVGNTPAPLMREIEVKGYQFIRRPKSILSENEFNFINIRQKLVFPVGWNDSNLTKLWLYNLHYFEGLLNTDTDESLKVGMIQRWVEENPPGRGNGWEAYPTSLRIVNWSKWAFSGRELSVDAIQSLAMQARYLNKALEYHLLGNHLFVNAKALVFVGLFFSGDEAEEWYSTGMEILEEQIPEQFLDDGGHFELSPTYHALLTEDLLDILYLLQARQRPIPERWEKSAQKAVQWLVDMTRPDGLPPLFNDASYGITPSLEDILRLAEEVKIEVRRKPREGLADLPSSGYFRYENERYSFFGDAGQIGPDYIPGHAHCDMLNFELYTHDQPFIVDTGVSTYEKSDRRHIERSTASHNTVQTDGMEQSEIWGAFRVAGKARIIERKVEGNIVRASCERYDHIAKQHERVFSFESTKISIQDKVSNSNLSTCNHVSRFHFHPKVAVKVSGKMVEAGSVRISFKGAQNVNLKSYKYAPEFNTLIPAYVVEVIFDKYLETTITL